ncbi:RagB/SusD family nutrient uptake outer membrane protein [Sphingobacterium sp. MYb382]|uniref:RagB/SusD family nutrient uptake outer membrane protein n=1 Tax=Sphingobacterium sp. MYb382 TaxID=2745278 RepID=UPI0030ADBD7C
MKKIVLLYIACALFSACSNKLDVAPPNSLTDEQIRELLAKGDAATIDLILGSMANNMPLLVNSGGTGSAGSDARYSSPQGLGVMKNLEANDIVFGDRALTIFGGDEYRFLDFISAESDKNAPHWNYGWNLVTQANKMLNFLDDQTVGSNVKLKEYKARGLTLRAYAYSYLMENYQDAFLQGGKDKLGVPLYDFYYPIQPGKARASSVETYNFIKNDLTTAFQLFSEAGVGYTTNLADFDLGVVNFLIAKVALATGDWATVIAKSNDILAKYPTLLPETVYGGRNTGTPQIPEIRPEKNGFLDNSANPEVILGYPVGQAAVVHNYWMNPFAEGNGGLGEGYERIDKRLYDKIDTRDFRRSAFLETAWGNYTYPTNNIIRTIPAYTNLKFAATHGVGSNDKKEVNSRVTAFYMRSSEVLLMKAEAQAQGTQPATAKETLNVLLAARTKQGQPALTCDNYASMAGLTPLQMVQLQTRIELWGEGGREFFNNKRWNIAVDRTSSTNHVDKSTYPVAKMTLQIPLDEILYNDKAVQN